MIVHLLYVNKDLATCLAEYTIFLIAGYPAYHIWHLAGYQVLKRPDYPA